jgi:hypothetical protein
VAGRITIFTKHGIPKVEVEADFHCNWVRNDFGRANFTMSLKDSKASERNLRFGNLIMYEHPDLPAWGGFIWPPRAWKSGDVAVSAQGGEFALNRGIAANEGSFKGTSKAVFRKVINKLGEQTKLPVIGGRIAGNSKKHDIDLRSQSFRSIVDEISQKGEQDWWFDPLRDEDNRLLFEANLSSKKGETVEFALVEGSNMEVTSGAREEGGLANVVLAIGEGSDTNRKTKKALSQPSINLYGATYAALFVNSKQSSKIEKRAKDEVERTAYPAWKFTGTVYTSSAMKKIRLGNNYPVQLNSIGFYEDGLGARVWAKVISMEYKDSDNALSVIFEQATDLEDVE